MKTISGSPIGRVFGLAVLACCMFGFACLAQAAPKKLLVVTVTKGFRHSSIPTAEKILAELGQESGVFTVDYVRTDEEMAQKMTAAALKDYDGAIFANTTGDLPLPDKQAFLDWIKSGKGFIATHSGSDTFHGFTPYIEMLGGEFETHKEHALLMLDKHPNYKTPGDFPIAWTKEYGKGRVFYTSLGHREDVWDPNTPAKFKRENPKEVSQAYQQHILGGIKWALGLEQGDARPQTIEKK